MLLFFHWVLPFFICLGEKLSKTQLQHTNIIKKLRVKEKESEAKITKQQKKIKEQEEELKQLQQVKQNRINEYLLTSIFVINNYQSFN